MADLVHDADDDAQRDQLIDLGEGSVQTGPFFAQQGNDGHAEDAEDDTSDGGAIHSGLLQQVLHEAGLAREATAEENSGEHGSDAADVGQNVCLRVAEIGVSGLSEVGLIAEADDDDQKRIEEDVCTGAAGETTGGVEGKGGDENEGDTAGAEVEGCPLKPLDREEHSRKDGDAVEGDAFWEGDAHGWLQCSRGPKGRLPILRSSPGRSQDRSVFDLKCSVAHAKPSCAVQFETIGG